MSKKCITCPKLGTSCDGANLMSMSGTDIIEWCKMRKSHLSLSNAKIAEASNVPKGTIDRIFSGENSDFRYETIRPIVVALIGGAFGADPCGERNTESDDATIRRLMDGIRKEKEDHRKSLDFWRKRQNDMRIAIIVLSVLLGATVAVIVIALILDRYNSGIGFFWLRNMK